jgi:hypothetical protein
LGVTPWLRFRKVSGNWELLVFCLAFRASPSNLIPRSRVLTIARFRPVPHCHQFAFHRQSIDLVYAASNPAILSRLSRSSLVRTSRVSKDVTFACVPHCHQFVFSFTLERIGPVCFRQCSSLSTATFAPEKELAKTASTTVVLLRRSHLNLVRNSQLLRITRLRVVPHRHQFAFRRLSKTYPGSVSCNVDLFRPSHSNLVPPLRASDLLHFGVVRHLHQFAVILLSTRSAINASRDALRFRQ